MTGSRFYWFVAETMFLGFVGGYCVSTCNPPRKSSLEVVGPPIALDTTKDTAIQDCVVSFSDTIFHDVCVRCNGTCQMGGPGGIILDLEGCKMEVSKWVDRALAVARADGGSCR